MKINPLVKIVNILEKLIALISMVAIAVAIILCAMQSFSLFMSGDFQLEAFLSTILTLVVGIEFVRMLLLHTPQSVIEVLLYAVARQIVISHENAIDNLIGVTAIAIIFLIQRYLLRPEKAEKIESYGGNVNER